MSSPPENPPIVKDASPDSNPGPTEQQEARAPVVFKMPKAAVGQLLAKKRPKPSSQSVSKYDSPNPIVAIESADESSEQCSKTPELNESQTQSSEADSSSYIQPPWGAPCPKAYSIQVLKSGVEVQTVDLLNRSWLLIGRQNDCHLRLEHPSLSRHHAVLQFSGCRSDQSESDTRYPPGWYLIDLGSTHGTLINKVRLQPQQYRRLRVGHVIRLAGSSRLLVLQGPESDREAESELTYTQLKERRDRRRLEGQLKLGAAAQSADGSGGSAGGGGGGCNWGFAEDAVEEEEETDQSEDKMLPSFSGVGDSFNPAEATVHSETYTADPLKFLRSWYDRQGLEPPVFKFEAPTAADGVIDFEDDGSGRGRRGSRQLLCCRLELPVDGPDGRPETAEAPMPPGTRRRDAVEACALAACRLLDRMGELDSDAGGGAAGSSRERRLRRLAENDFYEDEEDAFLDRTGQLEAKRRARMAAAAAAVDLGKTAAANSAVTFDELSERCRVLDSEIADLEARLKAADEAKRAAKASSGSSGQLDELEEYMRTIRAGGLDQSSRTQMRLRLMAAKKEAVLAHRMLEKARPTDLSKIGQATKARLASREMDDNKRNQRFPTVAAAPKMQEFLGEEVDDEVTTDKPDTVDNKPDSEAGTVVEVKPEEADNKVVINEEKPEKVNPDVVINEEKPEVVKKLTPIQFSAAAKKTNLATVVKQRPAWLDEVDEPSKPPVPLPPTSKKRRKNQAPPNSTADDVIGGYDATDTESYALWMPPSDQSGDGSTALNAKLGY